MTVAMVVAMAAAITGGEDEGVLKTTTKLGSYPGRA